MERGKRSLAVSTAIVLATIAVWSAARLSGAAPVTAAAPAAPPRLLAEGAVGYDIRDAKTGRPIPCKLTFIGVDGTRDPEFTRVDIARQEGDGAIAAFNRVMSIAGVGIARVPAGTYNVTVSRGPEWEIATIKRLKVSPQGASVTARLNHVVDAHGWLSADFHVHAARSSDSRVPMHDRIFEFVADDVRMIVATDHNVISDYEPIIRELDAGRYITSAIGDELTTNGWGHFGAFPLPRDAERAGEGAVLVHGRVPEDFFKDVRREAPGAIIDVHHPRIDAEIGYFDLGQFDARNDRAGRRGFSWDFDALEVMNGYQDPVRRSVDRVVDDWFALLNHDHVITATGNSDTHHLTYNIGGYPRNYVKVAEDRPESVDPKQVAEAVRFHHAFFTTGPFVRLLVNNGTIGDLVPARGGKAHADVTVQAAPWVSVSRVTLYLNGHEVQRWAVPPGDSPNRFHAELDLTTQRDGYVVVRVDGDKSLSPVVGDGKTFTAYPFALTNPVFLDVDGDGKYRTGLTHGH